MAEEQTTRLLCSKHPGQEKTHLVETDKCEGLKCPRHLEEWPNFLKYPVQDVVGTATGEIYRQNVLTGDIVR